MKMVIVEALEDLVYRPNIASQAQCVLFVDLCLCKQMCVCFVLLSGYYSLSVLAVCHIYMSFT